MCNIRVAGSIVREGETPVEPCVSRVKGLGRSLALPVPAEKSERFKSFSYDELINRDKLNLGIFWLKDDALEASANLPAPEIIAAEITADLKPALEQFATIAEDFKGVENFLSLHYCRAKIDDHAASSRGDSGSAEI